MLDEMTKENASKFVITKNYVVIFFVFHFVHEMKNEKITTYIVHQKCGKFWSISHGHFIKHKNLIYEECRKDLSIQIAHQCCFPMNQFFSNQTINVVI